MLEQGVGVGTVWQVVDGDAARVGGERTVEGVGGGFAEIGQALNVGPVRLPQDVLATTWSKDRCPKAGGMWSRIARSSMWQA